LTAPTYAMEKDARLPDVSQLKDYSHAVAGHAGTLQDDSGKLFIKPCTEKEINFYQTVQREASDPHPAKEKFRELRDIMPLFMGTLVLTDPKDSSLQDIVTAAVDATGMVKTDENGIMATVAEQIPPPQAKAQGEIENLEKEEEWVPTGGGKIKTDTAIVLGNASHGFVKPNILDLKLGVRLYADDAPAAKKQKMDKLSGSTTHKSYGFRIAGMKTYRGSDDATQLDTEEFMVYDKNYGRDLVDDRNLKETIGRFVFNEQAGIDRDLGEAVCAALAREVGNIADVLSQHDVTMYSASILIALEGDGKALERAIAHNNQVVEVKEKGPVAAKRVDSGIVLDDEGEFDIPAGPPMYSVQLIDFAHAKFLPEGSGPDENFMMGIRSVKNIFEELAQ